MKKYKWKNKKSKDQVKRQRNVKRNTRKNIKKLVKKPRKVKGTHGVIMIQVK